MRKIKLRPLMVVFAIYAIASALFITSIALTGADTSTVVASAGGFVGGWIFIYSLYLMDKMMP